MSPSHRPPFPFSILLFLSLTACAGDKGGGEEAAQDADGDGVTADLDCNDDRPDIYPGAPELCNAYDEDCDGLIDEEAVDAPTWYSDADRDGYGDAASSMRSCEPPPSSAEVSGDCDDSRGDAWPGAPETCNSLDDDCDGAADEEDAIDPLPWYADEDGDGYGQADLSSTGCTAPEGYAALSGDCEEGDPSIHPDAPERCNLLDDDCSPDTTELGVATFTSAAGMDSDLSGSLAGSVTLSEDGRLALCEGEWTVNLELAANIDVVGLSGDPSTVVLDGAGLDPVLTITGDGLSVSLSDLLLRGGEGKMVGSSEEETAGGGVYCEAVIGINLAFHRVGVEGNHAALGGGLSADNCTITVEESSFRLNEADAQGGAIWLGEGSSMSLLGADLGTEAGEDDNGQGDIGLGLNGFSYLYGDDTTLECTDSRCGAAIRSTLGSEVSDATWATLVRGNLFTATSEATIENFEAYVASDSSCTLSFYLVSSDDLESDEWSVDWEGSATSSSSGGAWVNSGDIGVPVEIGRHYGMLFASTSCDTTYSFDNFGGTDGDLGFGTSAGYWLSTGAITSGSTSIESRAYTGDNRYYQQVTGSH